MNIEHALQQGRRRLIASDSANIDTSVLLCSALQCPQSRLYAHPEYALSAEQQQTFNALISLRESGEPVAYLINSKEFWSMRLKVTTDTLIPRPETEILVETALDLIAQGSDSSILELGTGTGAISLALASVRPLLRITATDISEAALLVARTNARAHRINNIVFEQADWFALKKPHSYDMIISNPPYVCADDPHLEQGDVYFEPRHALVSGKEGLDDLRIIISHARRFLKQAGYLLLEHGFEQGAAVRALFKCNQFHSVVTIKDDNGLERVSLGRV